MLRGMAAIADRHCHYALERGEKEKKTGESVHVRNVSKSVDQCDRRDKREIPHNITPSKCQQTILTDRGTLHWVESICNGLNTMQRSPQTLAGRSSTAHRCHRCRPRQ